MKLNAAKTKEMLICFHSGHDVFPQLVINESVIERVNSTKVLGVMVDDTLTWNDHENYMYKKASSF